MEPPKGDAPKLPDMVVPLSMCGDHPSITKTELNVKEDPLDEKTFEKLLDKDRKERMPMSYTRISPSTSRTDRPERLSEQKSRIMSEHAMRMFEAKRHALRAVDVVSRHEDINVPANRALVQAALGSFRWPPYLVAVWVVVLVLTHVLHCLVTMLERALPSLKKFCTYFRTWAESSWRGDTEVNHRLFPLALAVVTALLYAAYVGLYAVYAIALWAVEPLCNEDSREDETKVTDYVVDEVTSKHNSSLNSK